MAETLGLLAYTWDETIAWIKSSKCLEGYEYCLQLQPLHQNHCSSCSWTLVLFISKLFFFQFTDVFSTLEAVLFLYKLFFLRVLARLMQITEQLLQFTKSDVCTKNKDQKKSKIPGSEDNMFTSTSFKFLSAVVHPFLLHCYTNLVWKRVKKKQHESIGAGVQSERHVLVKSSVIISQVSFTWL